MPSRILKKFRRTFAMRRLRKKAHRIPPPHRFLQETERSLDGIDLAILLRVVNRRPALGLLLRQHHILDRGPPDGASENTIIVKPVLAYNLLERKKKFIQTHWLCMGVQERK